MKLILLPGLLWAMALPAAHASWHYNENGGFGLYQPEGWSVKVEGRSSELLGPPSEPARTKIFLGSDWMGGITTLAKLESRLRRNELAPVATALAGLAGFRVGNERAGSFYLLRGPENVIVIHFQIRGSLSQREEGREALGSIEVRTEE